MARTMTSGPGGELFRAVIVTTWRGGTEQTKILGPFTTSAPAARAISVARNSYWVRHDGATVTGHVERTETVWAPYEKGR